MGCARETKLYRFLAGVLLFGHLAQSQPAPADPVEFVKVLRARGALPSVQSSDGSSTVAPLPVSKRLTGLQEELRNARHPVVGPTIGLLLGPGVMPNSPVEVGAAQTLRQSDT